MKDTKQVERTTSLLLALLLVLGGFDFTKKLNAKNKRLEVELANAKSKIELLEANDRFELNDVFVVMTKTNYMSIHIDRDLVTCKKHEMPLWLVNNLGKEIFEKDDDNENDNLIIKDFNFWGEETIFFSVKNGEICGSMREIYTNKNENPSVDVVAKYTQINFNGESEIIKTYIKAGVIKNWNYYDSGTAIFYITSLKDLLEYRSNLEKSKELRDRVYTNYIKGDLTPNYDSNLFFTKLRENLEYKTTSYTKEELIEIEDILNGKSKKRVLS